MSEIKMTAVEAIHSQLEVRPDTLRAEVIRSTGFIQLAVWPQCQVDYEYLREIDTVIRSGFPSPIVWHKDGRGIHAEVINYPFSLTVYEN